VVGNTKVWEGVVVVVVVVVMLRCLPPLCRGDGWREKSSTVNSKGFK